MQIELMVVLAFVSSVLIKKYLVDIGILTSGLIGALLLVGNSQTKGLWQILLKVITGLAVSYFLTPICTNLPLLHDWAIKTDNKLTYAVAFMLGTSGWGVVSFLQGKLFRSDKTQTQP